MTQFRLFGIQVKFEGGNRVTQARLKTSNQEAGLRGVT